MISARALNWPAAKLGAVVVIVSALVVLATMSGLIREPFKSGGRTVAAEFERAPQLRKGNQVRLDGHIQGRVEEIKDLDDGRGVRVTMTVEDAAGPIYADAKARLRAKTLLAGSFYVDIQRGSARAGELGSAAIPLRRTSVQVEIEDVTDIFRGSAIAGTRSLVRELSQALRDPRAPSRALATLERNAPPLQGGIEAVRGAEPGRDLPDVVANVERTVRVLDSPTDELGQLVAGAATTLQTTAARRQEISSIIRQSPPAASSVKTTLARLRTTLETAEGLVTRLRTPAPRVGPALADLHPAVVSTRRLLDGAQPLLRALRPAVSSLAGTAASGVPLVDGLRASLTRTDDQIIPGLARKDKRTGKSTSVMIGGFAAGFGAIAAQQDQNGHLIRFPASLTSTTAYLPCSSNLIDASAGSALACDSLQDALNEYLSYYPMKPRDAR